MSSEAWLRETADAYKNGERNGRRAAIEACAAEVAQAGCAGCTVHRPFVTRACPAGPPEEHDPRCPIALAARLRGLA